MRTCEVEGCDNKHQAKGLCKAHYNRQYQQANREKINQKNRNWKKLNPVKVREVNLRYERENRDKRRGYNRKWQQENPDKCRDRVSRRRALRKNNGAYKVTDRDVARLYASSCVACGSTDDITADHIIPLAKGGRHSIGNLQPLCRSCNSSKSDRLMVEWISILSDSNTPTEKGSTQYE